MRDDDRLLASYSVSFAGLWVLAKRLNPIPSRTRPLNASAPMVLWLKPWESRSLPGLPRTRKFPLHVSVTTNAAFLGKRRFCFWRSRLVVAGIRSVNQSYLPAWRAWFLDFILWLCKTSAATSVAGSHTFRSQGECHGQACFAFCQADLRSRQGQRQQGAPGPQGCISQSRLPRRFYSAALLVRLRGLQPAGRQ